MDSMTQVTHLPLCEIFYFRAIDNWVMFKLTGLNYFRHFPPSLPSFVFMHAFNHSTSAQVKKLCILVQTCDF